ncbi:MAG: C1 family peptidase [Chthonomonadetes bacterium]|nr:C1 family peptidase [Chthonomonadetes bacterium]
MKTSVDLRSRFKRWGLEPRAQGARGTCSVFAMVGAIEYAVARRLRKGIRLSAEYLNWAGHRATGRTADGGFFSEIWQGFETYGICPEELMPYSADYNPAMEPSPQAKEQAKRFKSLGLKLHWIKEWDVRTGATEEQLLTIKRVLQHGFPVSGGFRWHKVEKWVNGVLQMCPPEEVFDGHSVLLVGYRDDAKQPGGGVFFIFNSGSSEREAMIPYEYVRTYLNDAVWIE